MRFLSVCSGIEAASVAWHPLGWEAAAVAEIDPFACYALAHHLRASRPMFMPDPAQAAKLRDKRARSAAIKAVAPLPVAGAIPNFGDLEQFKDWPDAAIDLLVGGTPCQAFSLAGLRKGLDDPRGNLTLVYLAILERYRPRWMVWENVPGVLSDKGNAFGAFLGGLGQLGYGFAYRVLDAQYIRVDGFARAVPQRRRRVFVVGCLGDWRRAAAVLFERESLSGHPAPRRLSGERDAPTLSARTQGGGGLGTAFDCDGGLVAGTISTSLDKGGTTQDAYAGNLIAFGGNNQSGPIDVATALSAHGGTGRIDFGSETFVAHAPRAERFDASEEPGDPSHPLAKGARPPTIAFTAKDHGADAMENVSPTAAQAARRPASCEGQSTSGSWRVRRLMVEECEFLQGFPRGYTDIPYRGRNWTPDGPRYKALGNSMAVNAMRWIGTRISIADTIEEDAAA